LGQILIIVNLFQTVLAAFWRAPGCNGTMWRAALIAGSIMPECTARSCTSYDTRHGLLLDGKREISLGLKKCVLFEMFVDQGAQLQGQRVLHPIPNVLAVLLPGQDAGAGQQKQMLGDIGLRRPHR
jgi:hypothetical protein